MSARQSVGVLIAFAVVVVAAFFSVRGWLAKGAAERAKDCQGAREVRDKLRSVKADLEAKPPKTPREVALRLGMWSSCGDSSIKYWNKTSRFSWEFRNNRSGFPGGHVSVEVDKDGGYGSFGCDPDKPIKGLSVYGHDVDDESITRLYHCD